MRRTDTPGGCRFRKKKLPNIRLPEVTMRRIHASALLIVLLFGTHAFSQLDKIVIPAGTPEDQALTAITNEADPQKRIAMLDDFVQKFAANPAAVAYGNWQLEQAYSSAGDNGKALSYGDKALAANPSSIPTLILLANAYAEDPKGTNLTKAMSYARKAIELAKPDAPDADRSRKLSAGVAHSALGYALMREDKTLASIAEFKSATELLKEEPNAYSTALYRLGYG